MPADLMEAAAAIDSIPLSEMNKDGGNAPLREPDGRFAKLPAEEAAAAVEVKPEAKAPEVKAEADAKPEDDEEDYIELPPEGEGKEPTKLKLSQAVEAYRKAQTLEQELAKVREQGPPPDVWDQQIVETVRARQQLMANMQQWAVLNQPRQPDVAMLDPASGKYDPDGYFQQYKQHQALVEAHQKVSAEYQQLQQQMKQEQEAITRAQVSREAAKLEKIAPELKEKANVDKFCADLNQLYGLDQNTIDSVTDSRFFALAKDALAYRAQQATAQTAAKLVSAKPKLIPGKARATTTGNAATYAKASAQLQKSGSIDDATAAIASLL